MVGKRVITCMKFKNLNLWPENAHHMSVVRSSHSSVSLAHWWGTCLACVSLSSVPGTVRKKERKRKMQWTRKYRTDWRQEDTGEKEVDSGLDSAANDQTKLKPDMNILIGFLDEDQLNKTESRNTVLLSASCTSICMLYTRETNFPVFD